MKLRETNQTQNKIIYRPVINKAKIGVAIAIILLVGSFIVFYTQPLTKLNILPLNKPWIYYSTFIGHFVVLTGLVAAVLYLPNKVSKAIEIKEPPKTSPSKEAPKPRDIHSLENCNDQRIEEYTEALSFFTHYPFFSQSTKDFLSQKGCDCPNKEFAASKFIYLYGYDNGPRKGMLERNIPNSDSIEDIKMSLTTTLSPTFKKDSYEELTQGQMKEIYEWYKKCNEEILSFLGFTSQEIAIPPLKAIPLSKIRKNCDLQPIQANTFILFKEAIVGRNLLEIYSNIDDSPIVEPFSVFIKKHLDKVIDKTLKHFYLGKWLSS